MSRLPNLGELYRLQQYVIIGAAICVSPPVIVFGVASAATLLTSAAMIALPVALTLRVVGGQWPRGLSRFRRRLESY